MVGDVAHDYRGTKISRCLLNAADDRIFGEMVFRIEPCIECICGGKQLIQRETYGDKPNQVSHVFSCEQVADDDERCQYCHRRDKGPQIDNRIVVKFGNHNPD